MRVEIRTSGGFTGRGIGNAAIDDAASLQLLIDAALMAPDSSTGKTMPDSVHYQMTITHGSRQRTFTWSDDAPPAAAVLALFNAAWALRE